MKLIYQVFPLPLVTPITAVSAWRRGLGSYSLLYLPIS